MPQSGPAMQSSMPMSSRRKWLPVMAILVFVIGASMFFMKSRNLEIIPEYEGNSGGGNENIEIAEVNETPVVNGFLSTPPGLPSDIPVEPSNIVESATTNYPGQSSSQLSVTYTSSKTVAQKYAEYKTYMTGKGYSITEGSASAPVRAIFGTKADANLSVAISTSQGKTLVQLSYLLK